jgi:hypothetical protein
MLCEMKRLGNLDKGGKGQCPLLGKESKVCDPSSKLGLKAAQYIGKPMKRVLDPKCDLSIILSRLDNQVFQ